jgi:hypothetical protein
VGHICGEIELLVDYYVEWCRLESMGPEAVMAWVAQGGSYGSWGCTGPLREDLTGRDLGAANLTRVGLTDAAYPKALPHFRLG